MTQAMLLNWAVGRALAAARAADSGVGSPRSPPPVSIQRGAERGGAGRDARGRLGIRRTKYRRVPAIFSGSSGARSSRKKGRPGLVPERDRRSRHLVLGLTRLVPGNGGVEGRGLKGGAGASGGALLVTRARSRPGAVIPHLLARAPQASGPGLATRPTGRVLTREGAELPAATTS